jgi:large subunit ribosomal protein L29
MKTSELRPKSIGELDMRVKELRGQLINMRFELKDKKLKNVASIMDVKKNLAQTLTILREKKFSV